MPSDVLFCTDTFWDDFGDQIVALDPSIEVVRLVDDEEITQGDLERITISFASPDTYPDRIRQFLGVTLRCPNLRWLQTAFAGTDAPAFQELIGRGVTLSTASGAAATDIAHTVIMYLLQLSRDAPRLMRAQADRRWAPEFFGSLHDKKLGIVGYGAIGAEVARLADAFGMQVVGLRRTPRGDEATEIWPNERLHELLEWADAIVVTAPLTDETRRMFGEAEFARMRQGAWFVNVGRGAIVDEQAMTAALADGHLGGAGLDVFEVEPLPSDSPLWDLPNVIITPHASGDTDLTDARSVEIGIENFRRHTTGEPLANRVN
jgi:phosphoglycerate dehydrogenase-like enzyme